MNHSLRNTQSLVELREELREVADTWRSVLFGTAMGMLHVLANRLALKKSRASRNVVRHAGHEAPGNWRR